MDETDRIEYMKAEGRYESSKETELGLIKDDTLIAGTGIKLK